MSRSVTLNYDQLRVGGSKSGKTAQARQTIGQYARDRIAAGADPQHTITIVGLAGITHHVPYWEAAEWAFIGDIIDNDMKAIIEKETP